MSEELKTAIYIAVEISVFAILIVIIAFFGEYSMDALNIKKEQDVGVRNIIEYRDLYEIDKGNKVDISLKRKDKEISNDDYLRLKEFGLNNYKNDNYFKWSNFTDESKTVQGDDIFNYILKKGGKYDIYIYLGGNITCNNIFGINLIGNELQELLESRKIFTNVNNIFEDNYGSENYLGIRVEASIQNENLVSFLREYLNDYAKKRFYCVSIFDSTDNTHTAIVFNLVN